MIEILDILNSGDFDKFIGQTESDILEAKGPTPYDLSNPSGRYELAKDVTAFANAEGGYILMGLETGKLTNERADRVKATKLIAKTAFGEDKVGGVLKQNVYPIIDDLEIKWYPSKDDPLLGIASIYVPKQSPNIKPFLVTRIFESGEPQKQNIIGIFKRSEADNVPTTAKDIHQIIQYGNDPVLQRTIRIEEKLDLAIHRVSQSPTTTISTDLVLTQHINELKSE